MACPIAQTLAALPPRAALAVGSFDGLHLGHRAILREMTAFANATGRPACVLTFGQLPLTLLDPAHAPGRIEDDAATLARLQEALADCEALIIRQAFTPAFATCTADAFHAQLRGATLFCGEDWRFGAGASGTPEFLRARGLEVHVIPYALWHGERISSTRIRAALARGAMDEVAAMLGRPWCFTGCVAHGRGLAGRSLGVPTLNLPYCGRAGERLTLPARGVYRAHAQLSQAGQTHAAGRALVNFGVAPTLKAEASPLFEAHLLDCSGDFYDLEATLSFAEPLLRPERTFPTLEALKAQIALDLAAVRH